MKWEYKALLIEHIVQDKFADLLNEYGQDGWRVSHICSLAPLRGLIVFEQPKSELVVSEKEPTDTERQIIAEYIAECFGDKVG